MTTVRDIEIVFSSCKLLLLFTSFYLLLLNRERLRLPNRSQQTNQFLCFLPADPSLHGDVIQIPRGCRLGLLMDRFFEVAVLHFVA
jgi:hypothetical protein